MHILFYDPLTPWAYSKKIFQKQSLGGTEATVLRIAEGLAPYHAISITQAYRQEPLQEENIHYLPLEQAHGLTPDVVVLLRSHLHLLEVGKRYRNARLFFWIHNTPSNALFRHKRTLAQYHYQIIAVSHYQRELAEKKLLGKWWQRLLKDKRLTDNIPVHILYNPIADDLQPDTTPWDKNKLLFLSSPHKGLAETLKLFQSISYHYPEYQLYLTNPGYQKMTLPLTDKVHYLGSLPHAEVIQKLRESFCVFYPQYVNPETFGLIYAEANAVGTPVLAHDFGAAREVLSDATQLIDGSNPRKILQKITAWREKRLVVRGKPEFRLQEVIKRWQALLSRVD